MLLPAPPQECICVSEGTDCSVTLCCCRECEQRGWTSRPCQRPFRVEPPSVPVNGTGCVGVALVAPCGSFYVDTGTLMENSFMLTAMSCLLPFPGFCLGMQQKKRLCCPGIVSAVSRLSPIPPHPGSRTAAARSAVTFINRGGFEKEAGCSCKGSLL